MDISNSTGDSTGYRVRSSGAAPCPPPTAESSPLEDCVVEELSLEEETDVQAESRQEKGMYGKAMPVLREGELKPGTYVTVQIPGSQACTVEFHRNNKTIRRYSVRGRHEEILLALAPNGGGTPPNTLIFSKSKV